MTTRARLLLVLVLWVLMVAAKTLMGMGLRCLGRMLFP